MKFELTTDTIFNSITGLSALTALSFLLLRKYNLAAAVFGALTMGSIGVAWDRYSTKSGSALDVRVIKKKRKPDKDEMKFIVSHLPYAALAIVSYLADKKLQKSK